MLFSRSSSGVEVFDSYGPKCNSRFVVNYGFVLEDNEENQAVIRLQLDPEDPLYWVKLRFLGSSIYYTLFTQDLIFPEPKVVCDPDTTRSRSPSDSYADFTVPVQYGSGAAVMFSHARFMSAEASDFREFSMFDSFRVSARCRSLAPASCLML
jgi:hypothetical protein